jgi:hypothetical protein
MTDKPDHESNQNEEGHPATFKVQIDKGVFETTNPLPTARQLLELAVKLPPDHFALYKKVKGGQPQRLELDQKVDLSDPGIERFVTLPLDQTEGLEARRQFALPEDDREWLDQIGLRYELVAEGGVPRVVIYGWPVPPDYTVARVDINVRIESGYPEAQIDMAYFHPPLALKSGRSINATCAEGFDGKTWQRWSRHRTAANPWRPGVDCLATHFALADSWIARELSKR